MVFGWGSYLMGFNRESFYLCLLILVLSSGSLLNHLPEFHAHL
jgi:hypothetical protein